MQIWFLFFHYYIRGNYGTSGYSAPEITPDPQCTYTIAVDSFSLGATIHHIITNTAFAQTDEDCKKLNKKLNENIIQ